MAHLVIYSTSIQNCKYVWNNVLMFLTSIRPRSRMEWKAYNSPVTNWQPPLQHRGWCQDRIKQALGIEICHFDDLIFDLTIAHWLINLEKAISVKYVYDVLWNKPGKQKAGHETERSSWLISSSIIVMRSTTSWHLRLTSFMVMWSPCIFITEDL